MVDGSEATITIPRHSMGLPYWLPIRPGVVLGVRLGPDCVLSNPLRGTVGTAGTVATAATVGLDRTSRSHGWHEKVGRSTDLVDPPNIWFGTEIGFAPRAESALGWCSEVHLGEQSTDVHHGCTGVGRTTLGWSMRLLSGIFCPKNLTANTASPKSGGQLTHTNAKSMSYGSG